MKRLALFSMILLASFALVLGINGNAQATYFTCNGTECSGTWYDDNDSASDLNSNTFGGFSDWNAIIKWENPGYEPSSNYYNLNIDVTEWSSDGDALAGNWAIDPDIWSNYDHIAVALKDGEEYGYIAFLLPEDCVSGTWEFGFGKNLSHFSVYGGGTSVPDASIMLLLGSSLLVFGLLTWKPKKR